jgi:hypothetical protein
MPLTPFSFSRLASSAASSSVASETSLGRQRRAWAKTSSRLRPAASAATLVTLGKLLDDGEGAFADGAGGTENGESFQRLILLLL